MTKGLKLETNEMWDNAVSDPDLIEKIKAATAIHTGYCELFMFPPLGADAFALIPDGPNYKIHRGYVYRVDMFCDQFNGQHLNDRTRARWWLDGYDSPVAQEEMFPNKESAEEELQKRTIKR